MRFLLSVTSADLDRLFTTLEEGGFLLRVGRAGNGLVPDLHDRPGQLGLIALPGDDSIETSPEPSIESRAIVVDDLEIDTRAHRAWRAGRLIDLSHREFELLTALARFPDRVLSREALLAEVWKGVAVTPNVIEVHISTLRRKLEAYGPRVIETVRGVGYVLRSPSAAERCRGLGHERARITGGRSSLRPRVGR